jgi:L-ribulose-5-phosphate 4-epimerase
MLLNLTNNKDVDILKNKMDNKEGYIKFNGIPIPGNPPEDIEEINKWRDKFYSLGLIGTYSDGTGFGNISVRDGRGVIITGSKTGGIEKLTNKHYVKIIGWSLEENRVAYVGTTVEASSESPSHIAIYENYPKANAVIHVHSLKLWENLFEKIPTTSIEAEYGTPEMADEIYRLFKETNIKRKKILVMGGHKEGVIAFGKSLNEAGRILLKYFNRYK